MASKSILTFSCPHIPFNHRDFITFLSAVRDKHDCRRVVCLGDEVDNQAMKFHPVDPDLPSPGDELRLSIKVIKELESAFPRMDIVESNHAKITKRRLKAAFCPSVLIKSYHGVYGVSKKWQWHHKGLILNLPDGKRIKFVHKFTKNTLGCAQRAGLCIVQGHHHTVFAIEHMNADEIRWAMTVGCLVDDASSAFDYNKEQTFRPILGCGVIVDGWPRLIEMKLTKDGRWNRKLV